MIKKNNNMYKNFLHTAAIEKIPETKCKINYLEFDNELKLKLNTKDINCENIILPKEENLLNAHLLNKLYNKYYEMAFNNDKGLKNKLINLNFLDRWLKEDYDIFMGNKYIEYTEPEAQIDYRKLFVKMHLAGNLIAANSRIGGADFIVINYRLAKFLIDCAHYNANLTFDLKSNNNDVIQYIGNLTYLDVYVNLNEDEDNILIGRNTKDVQNGGVICVENKREVIGDYIKWTGAIEEISENSKYMYDLIKVKFVDDLVWYKKFIYKFAKKMNWINF